MFLKNVDFDFFLRLEIVIFSFIKKYCFWLAAFSNFNLVLILKYTNDFRPFKVFQITILPLDQNRKNNVPWQPNL